jgi:hypothetical protein
LPYVLAESGLGLGERIHARKSAAEFERFRHTVLRARFSYVLSESGLRPSPRATAPAHNTLFFAGEAVGVKDKPGNVASVH